MTAKFPFFGLVQFSSVSEAAILQRNHQPVVLMRKYLKCGTLESIMLTENSSIGFAKPQQTTANGHSTAVIITDAHTNNV